MPYDQVALYPPCRHEIGEINLARKSLIAALSLLIVFTAACSSSSTSAQAKPTTTVATTVPKLSSQECGVLTSGLKQVSADVLTIGLSGVGAKGASPSSVPALVTDIKSTLSSLAPTLKSIVPATSLATWESSMLAYASGLAQAARAGNEAKLNEFNSQFQATSRGQEMARQLALIQTTVTQACSHAGAG